ncbi:hypothetical protein [Pseudomonas pseudonitroreducens]|uniref:hypothetical protein n=1 Tax=Pseudomonas pseudonitroreducens TaxID=2892326 RepID=UPI001F40DF31|nr:hypothetical protein [Pseudomonas pseudonitroreducens]
MDINVYNINEISNEKIIEKIKKKESFTLANIESIKLHSTVETLERLIESQGLKCRIYTFGRIAAAGASVAGGVTGLLGALSGIAIAAHNIATWNPDYEIAKNLFASSIHVTYKK